MALFQGDIFERAGVKYRPDDSKRWLKVQELFAKVIGVNLVFFDAAGNKSAQPHRVAPSLSDMVISNEGIPYNDPPSSLVESLKKGEVSQKKHFEFQGLRFYALPINWNERRVGTFVIGPVFVGKREDREVYRKQCEASGIDAENFLDYLQEVKLYSNVGISTVLSFLEEMTYCFFDRVRLENEMDDIVPTVLAKGRGIEGLLSVRYAHELAESLLDIALGLVEGQSGSVLLYDEEQSCFQIQAARGLKQEIVRDSRISSKNSVAGLVARAGKPMLIHQETEHKSLKKRFVKQAVTSSIVIPLIYRNDKLGLLCLNAETNNDQFNQKNLSLLDQLGKISSVAFARFNESAL